MGHSSLSGGVLYFSINVFLSDHLFVSACIILFLDKVVGIGSYPCSLFFRFKPVDEHVLKLYLNGFVYAIIFNSFNVYE